MPFNQVPEIVYQIMPDRFARAADDAIPPEAYPPGAHLSDWGDPVSAEFRGKQYFGGTLRGIQERLPFLAELGVTAIMLTPIFPAPSYHKYDATDFRRIDPGLGSDADFDRFLAACHDRGMKLILDLAVNHLSSRHPLFEAAKADPQAPERALFRFAGQGDEYESWWGYRGMPEINYDEPAARREFVEGPDSVIAYWCRRGIDGIRLDCANDLSPGVVQLIRETARRINPAIYVMGEIFSYPAEWLRYLDGVMNYSYREALSALFAGRIGTKVFGAFLSQLASDAGIAGLSDSLSMLSSHDTPRLKNQFNFDRTRIEQALLLQFTLPGVPMIWSGEELGMEGGGDPLNRRPPQWDEPQGDGHSREHYRRLIQLRRERAELHRGDFVDLSPLLPEGVIGYLRRIPHRPGSFCVVLANPGNQPLHFTLFLPESHCYSTMVLKDALGEASFSFVVGAAAVTLAAGAYHCLVPQPQLPYPNYRFYKNQACPVELGR